MDIVPSGVILVVIVATSVEDVSKTVLDVSGVVEASISLFIVGSFCKVDMRV